MFYADLHIHSKFSRATSRDADLEHMAIWARKKGISVLGTGDFTHPVWLSEIKEKLVPAEPGLFRLRGDLQREVDRQCGVAAAPATRFMLEVEISTIYKKGDRTRKIHHLVYVPDLESADRLVPRLSRIGNLKSDGRPILGLDSRDLLEITLESGQASYLIPAHIWTPWFAVLGSKSGFDAVDDCYGDLSSEIFALETGLSSDPPMNWRLSSLDRFQLVSNSDAHSPPKIGREACAFTTDMDYYSMRGALETGEGYAGTVEFFPEEGKYHLDGHRKCGIRLDPQQTRQHQRQCPVCGKEITIGVMNRVDELADRPVDYQPEQPTEFQSLVPLPEVLSEIRGVGEKSKKVQHAYHDLVSKLGPELFILNHAPVEDIRREGSSLIAEAVQRMRAGEVICQAGFDGEYGRIHLFEEGELNRRQGAQFLFEPIEDESDDRAKHRSDHPHVTEPSSRAAISSPNVALAAEPSTPVAVFPELQQRDGDDGLKRIEPSERLLDRLDDDQRSAAEIETGPLRIIAGPGTGKTRTLTYRIAHLVQRQWVSASQCLTVTFSRRAAAELQQRLAGLLSDSGEVVPVFTFHSLGHQILMEYGSAVGLPDSFQVATHKQRHQMISDTLSLTTRQADRVLKHVSRIKRSEDFFDQDTAADDSFRQYADLMNARGWVDYDDLITLPLKLLQDSPEVVEQYRERWPWVSVDEFQDIDLQQYLLIRQLAPAGGNVCVIGDPDQSIYQFRGADPRLFQSFQEDYPTCRTVMLRYNYRSSRTIVDASMDFICPTSQAGPRTIEAQSTDSRRIDIQECGSETSEAEWVVQTIERLMGGASFFSLDSGRVDGDEPESWSFGDFAVLYRTDAQAEPLVEAFRRSGLPFQKRSHRLLLDEPSIASIVQTLQQPGPEELAMSSVQRLQKAIDRVRSSYPEIEELANPLLALAQEHADDMQRLLERLTTDYVHDLWDPRADRVSMLTLHASKGLEFPVVFLVGCEERLLPLQWGSDSDADLDEERRLFFVGMTRAQDRLLLSHAQNRCWRGQPRAMKPSRFLTALQEELLKHGDRIAKQKRSPAEKQLNLF